MKNKKRLEATQKIVIFLSLYYVIYGIILQMIEPLGWFSEQPILQKLGPWANILIIIVPAIIVAIYYFATGAKEQFIKEFLGVSSVTTGARRSEEFRKMIERAQHQIIIVGIGMTSLSRYGRDALEEQAKRIPIDLLMLDPEALQENTQLASMLENFRDIPGLTQGVHQAFQTLKQFCQNWNNNPNHRHAIQLKVYNVIPTMTMVLIDPEHENGEILIEFFLYRSGKYRPAIHIKKVEAEDNMFDILKSNYERLAENARRVI